ncbi:MAG: hypothetical protein WCO50_08800, partial [Synechococcus sp. ELA619]
MVRNESPLRRRAEREAKEAAGPTAAGPAAPSIRPTLLFARNEDVDRTNDEEMRQLLSSSGLSASDCVHLDARDEVHPTSSLSLLSPEEEEFAATPPPKAAAAKAKAHPFAAFGFVADKERERE